MCRTPCWGTPEDIAKLIAGGHATRLMVHMFHSADYACIELLSPANPGFEGRYADQGLNAVSTLRSGCVFLGVDKTCAVHVLKPSEGKIGCCKSPQSEAQARAVREHLARAWDGERGRQLVRAWKEAALREAPITARQAQEAFARRLGAAMINLVGAGSLAGR